MTEKEEWDLALDRARSLVATGLAEWRESGDTMELVSGGEVLLALTIELKENNANA